MTVGVNSRALAVVVALVWVAAIGCAAEPDVATQGAARITDGDAAGGPVDDLRRSGAGAPVPDDPDVRIGTLANGLTYYIRHNERPGGRAELRLAVNAGSVDEEPDQSGVAHFVEHMLFNGTEQFPENELIDVLRGFGAEFGADINAFTSYDETVYQLTVATDDDEVVATGLDVLAQWLSAATLDPTAVEQERGVVLDEWRGSAESSQGRVFDAIERLFLAGTAYEGRDPIGTSEAIESMTPEPLRRFYDAWYRPDNAALVVVGDIDVDDIEQAIVERFESLTSRAQPPAVPDLAFVADTEPAVEVLADPDQPAAFVEVTLPAPAVIPAAPACWRDEVLDGIAFEAIADRLASDVSAGGVAFTSASVDSNSHVRGLDAPSVLADTSSEGVPATLQAILDEMERVDRDGFGTNEISRLVAQRRTAAESAYEGACDSPRRRIRRVVRRQLPRRLADPRRDDGARADDRHPRRRHARCRRRPVPGAMDGDRSARPRRRAGGRTIAGTRRPARHDRRARRSRTGTAGRRRHRGDRADGASRTDHRVGGRVAHRGAVGVPRTDRASCSRTARP